ncbi:hypothetical protein TIFTF001_044186 [Ficus carica]|uniref:Uncharacterized protein n=1 Tax=Ficus carica TaxID=3494 RepID=A0AA87ZJ73_FICCA|nr:hypothetical protein TIFTF001_044186 [Ficus carica]
MFISILPRSGFKLEINKVESSRILSESAKIEDDVNDGESKSRGREADHEEDEEPFPKRIRT